MIYFGKDWDWSGIAIETYKDEPGTWVGVTRRTLSQGSEGQFEVRYFEIAPGGYTSYEMHQHEHCVMVVRGHGEVRLQDTWSSISEQDIVRVEGCTPHQFRNSSDQPFGILCIVDKNRDRPVLLGDGAKDSSAVPHPCAQASKA